MLPSPDPSASFLAWVLLGPALILGVFLPGYLIFQKLASPLPWVTSFIGSGLALFGGVLLLDLSSLKLNLFTLAGLLTLFCLIGWRLRGPHKATLRFTIPKLPQVSWSRLRQELWWIIPALIAYSSLLLHTIVDPLSGFDNFFRWNYLALLMNSQGSLAHYPAVTAVDFLFYPWCDGIPPLVPIINLWIYLSTGSTAAVLIFGRVVVELSLTLGLVWHLARNLWGAKGARVAILALSTSTLFLWSMGMEQETGLSGIAYLSITALLISYRKRPSNHTVAWLALAAAFGALCRDYNLILIPSVLLGLICAKASRKHLLIALGITLLVTAPWYLRNAWLTGNPLYPHDLAGLFPPHPVHRDYTHAIREMYTFSNPDMIKTLLHGFLIGFGALFLLALPGLCSSKFGARVVSSFALLAFGLCLLAITSTAGGPFYALRVLGPALPLLAVAAGRLAHLLSPSKLVVLGLILLPLSADAARRSWIYVWAPYESPWPYTWNSWKGINQYIKSSQNAPIWHQLKVAAHGESIVIHHPSYQILLGRIGASAIPIFSPEAEALTSSADTNTFPHAIEELRSHRIRFVLLADDGLQNTYYFRSRPITRQLLAMEPTLKIDGMLIYDLFLIKQQLSQQQAEAHRNQPQTDLVDPRQ